MSVQALFSRLVKGVADQLTGYGFERDKRTFRCFSPEGDGVIVEFQPSDHSTRFEKVFYINVALTVAPKWERDRLLYGLPASVRPGHLHGLWRHRIGFSGGDQWRITDEASAAEMSDLIRRRLDETVPLLLPALDRAVLLGNPPEFLSSVAWMARGWVLAERGPSEELERLLFAKPTTGEFSSVARKAIWDWATSRRSRDREGQR
ncbi:DUF4304 domain-containing protein [Micromonospora sp. S-DT3-3-22]|uniref:DUF4304 domain-containing protein n=1 Tax=Micromonospora sp. S-DT3-3-22 TaxID=2755359 RepID=UPI00188DDB83|nr:DUF4304 domain-containing protein [Micromonospora sp. S-DT3-3-22]